MPRVLPGVTVNIISIAKTAGIVLATVYIYNAFLAPDGKTIADFGRPDPKKA